MIAPAEQEEGTAAKTSSNSTSPTPLLPSLSINQLAARHPRERLLVHPFLWTSRHVDLLGCRIHFDKELDGPPPRCTVERFYPRGLNCPRFELSGLNCPRFEFNLSSALASGPGDSDEYLKAIKMILVSHGYRVSWTR